VVVRVAAPRCAAEGGRAALPPEVALAEARVAEARAAASLARARARPDLQPTAGLRRTAGFSGLFLGLGFELPLLNGYGSQRDSALAEADAALAERDGLVRRVGAEAAAARAGLDVLDRQGDRFDDAWRQDLERVTRAADARFRAGEGTLLELLDARRARLAAVAEYETWRAERRRVRALLARLEGRPVTAAALCDDVSRE